MRLWIDGELRTYTDEQLLRHIAHFGSLEKALEHGDISLLSESKSQRTRAGENRKPAKLADYLED